MNVIPVLDLKGGRAVRALGGDRAAYEPLASVLEAGSDPLDLARACRAILGVGSIYLADLDAIEGDRAPDLGLFRGLGELGLAAWVDAGVRTAGDLPGLFGAGVAVAVVGLETVAGPDELARMVDEAGPDRLAFSLDVRDGRPLVPTRGSWGTDDPDRLVDRAIAAGIRRIIHLDLARVGTGRGLSRPALLPRPGVEWAVGGGIAGPEDLDELRPLGVAAALVGAAIHSGRIGSVDLDARPWISGRRTS